MPDDEEPRDANWLARLIDQSMHRLLGVTTDFEDRTVYHPATDDFSFNPTDRMTLMATTVEGERFRILIEHLGDADHGGGS